MANTHIHWDPSIPELKLAQAHYWCGWIARIRQEEEEQLMKEMEAGKCNDGTTEQKGSDRQEGESSEHDTSSSCSIPLLLCGDLNSLPSSAAHEYLLKGEVCNVNSRAVWMFPNR